MILRAESSAQLSSLTYSTAWTYLLIVMNLQMLSRDTDWPIKMSTTSVMRTFWDWCTMITIQRAGALNSKEQTKTLRKLCQSSLKTKDSRVQVWNRLVYARALKLVVASQTCSESLSGNRFARTQTSCLQMLFKISIRLNKRTRKQSKSLQIKISAPQSKRLSISKALQSQDLPHSQNLSIKSKIVKTPSRLHPKQLSR